MSKPLTIDEILEQAYTDGASDTMWQNDRHVEIYATAKQKLTHLIAEIIGEVKMYKWEDGLNPPETIEDASQMARDLQRAEQRQRAKERGIKL